MPFLYAALYVFRWAFLVGGVFNLLVGLYFVTVAQPTDVEKAVTLLVAGGVFIALAFIGRILLEREA